MDVTLDRSEVRTQLRLGGGWFLVLVTTELDNFSGGFIEYEGTGYKKERETGEQRCTPGYCATTAVVRVW